CLPEGVAYSFQPQTSNEQKDKPPGDPPAPIRGAVGPGVDPRDPEPGGLLRSEYGVLEGLHGEDLGHRLCLDLDGLARLRVAAHASGAMALDAAADAGDHKFSGAAPALLGGERGQGFEEPCYLLLLQLALLRHCGHYLTLAHWLGCHGILLSSLKIKLGCLRLARCAQPLQSSTAHYSRRLPVTQAKYLLGRRDAPWQPHLLGRQGVTAALTRGRVPGRITPRP